MSYFRRREVIASPRSSGTLFRAREQLDWPIDRDFHILSIDGGGIRGILPLAVMARLEENYLSGRSIASAFDLIVGTSTGGIIALGLSAGKTAREIYDLYIRQGGEVFPDHSWFAKQALNKAQLLLNRCSKKKLYSLIDSILGNKELWQSEMRLCIPSSETRHFEPFIYKTPHHPDYKLDWCKSMAHVAKATSAAPSFYPPIRKEGYEFVDGGIWANNPIMIGIADTLACFIVPPRRIRVLSTGCVADQFSMSWTRRAFGGQLFWTSLIFESMHLSSQNVIGQARLIVGGDRVSRIDAPAVKPPLEMWDWARCCELLPGMARKLVDEHGEEIRTNFLTHEGSRLSPYYTTSNPPP